MAFITADEMRAVELAAIRSGAVSGQELMERAGQGVVAAISETWPHLARSGSPYLGNNEAPEAVVLCGPGNNGGDGFAIARLLSGKGWRVRVYFLGEAARLPDDARVNHDRWCEIGEVAALREFGGQGCADLVVDALFGIGLSRPVDGRVGALLAGLEGPVVAVDVPSGLDADTGDVPGRCARAALTVTFHRAKPGHLRGRGPALCGKVIVKDIGL